MPNTLLNRTTVARLQNKSGGALAFGDVVIVSGANEKAVATDTTGAYKDGKIGVVLEPNGIADNAWGVIGFGGWIPQINLSAPASLGNVFRTHTVAGQAVPHAAPMVVGDFGQVLETGSTPSAVLFEHVEQGSGATPALSNSDISPTTADVVAIVGTRYFADISGLTADRNFILPTCADGDEIELKITVGDDTYELIIIGDTGVAIEGGGAATEWSRVFIAGEIVRFVADATNSWRVIYDGRIPCMGLMTLSGNDTVNTASTATLPTWDNAEINIGNICDLPNKRFNIRRAGYYKASGIYHPANAVTDAKRMGARVYLNGTGGTLVSVAYRQAAKTTALQSVELPARPQLCAVGDYLDFYYQPEEANIGINTFSWCQIEEG